MKTNIVRSLPDGILHRAGITSCPHCGFISSRGDIARSCDVWAEKAKTLVLDTVHGKHGSVAVVSECPECFELSWVHQPFSFFSEWMDIYSVAWKRAANAEHTRRHMDAVHTFADSLCAKCQHLRSLECDTLPIVQCTFGTLPVVGREEFLHNSFTETECPQFLART